VKSGIRVHHESPPPHTPKRKQGTRIYIFHLHIIQYYEHVTSEITTEMTDLYPLKMNVKQRRGIKCVPALAFLLHTNGRPSHKYFLKYQTQPVSLSSCVT